MHAVLMMEDKDDDTDFRKRMLKGFCIDTDPEIADQEDYEASLDMADDSDDSDVTAESADAKEGGIPDGTDLRSTMLKSCHSNPIIELFESLIIDETARREKDEITDPRTFMLRPKPLTEEKDEAPQSPHTEDSIEEQDEADGGEEVGFRIYDA